MVTVLTFAQQMVMDEMPDRDTIMALVDEPLRQLRLPELLHWCDKDFEFVEAVEEAFS